MNVALIGKSFPRLAEYLSENGHTYTVFQDKLLRVTTDSHDAVIVDLSQIDTAIEQVRSAGKFDTVFCIYEQYITVTAKIAQALNLRGLSIDASEACTNKAVMRDLFSRAPIKISPDFAIVRSIDDITSFMQSHTFPVILKPANLTKSLLVKKCTTMAELLASYSATLERIETVYARYAPRNERIIIIEEFMEGSVHSVAAFVGGTDSEIHLLSEPVDYESGYEIGYDDTFHYSRILPSVLSATDQSKVFEVAREGIKALGMTYSAAHIEIIMTNEGPKIVEIGARIGGYRERMYLSANGIDMYGAFLDTMTGKTPVISAKKHESCAVLELFPKENGIFSGISNQSALEKLESFQNIAVKFNRGDLCGKSSAGFKAVAIIMMHHEDEDVFRNDLKYVKQHVEIITT